MYKDLAAGFISRVNTLYIETVVNKNRTYIGIVSGFSTL